MFKTITNRLGGVRRRQRAMRAIRWSITGTFAGAILGLVLAVLWRMSLGVPWWTPLVTIAAGGGSATLAAVLAPSSWKRAARGVDQRYDLKDRATTALQFASDDRGDPLRKLQVSDALEKLAGIDPKLVVPWRTPRWVYAAIGTTLAVALIMLIPVQRPVVAGVPTAVRDLLQDQANYLDETMLEELHKLAEQDDENSKELDNLVTELEELVDELRNPAVDEREALANLSMMQQAVSASLASFNLQQVDSALQSFASALEPADEMRAIAAKLREGDYDKAANELESVDPEELSNKEKRAVADKLKKLSAELGSGNPGQLSEAALEMSEGLSEKDGQSKCKNGARKLAKLCRKQSLRKSIGECLGAQLNRLAMCKSDCKNGCNSIARSNSPSNRWGTGATNKPFGDVETHLDSQRELQRITGQQGDGASEREVITSTEARQLAARSYQQRYSEFRKRAEAVLESEPLPLGHRQTVRQYFESIRPNDEVAD